MCEDDELSHFMMKSIDSGTQEVLSEAPFLHMPHHSSLSQHPGEWGGRLWLLYFISISGDSKYPSGWVKSIFNINTPFVPSWPLWHSSLSVLFPNWRRRDGSEKKSLSREAGIAGGQARLRMVLKLWSAFNVDLCRMFCDGWTWDMHDQTRRSRGEVHIKVSVV